MRNKAERVPSWWASTIPFAVLVATLVCVVKFFGADSLVGASQVALLLASGTAVAISMIFYGVKWQSIDEGISANVKTIATALLILLMIGAIAGSWMISGVVPTLICYGLKVISPSVFLLAACVISALVSVMTGSSWTTIATIGVALIGIGEAFGFSSGWTAGAIISGAYFGDKISPLSDTTVLASSSAGTELFKHIRYMFITTVPSITIACIVFLVASLTHSSSGAAHTEEIVSALRGSFHISGCLMIVPILTLILIIKRLPALLTLFLAALMAGITALIAQPEIIWSIAGGSGTFSGLSFSDGFKGLMITYYGDTAVNTGNTMLNDLVSTSGMNGMLSTIFLILCAITFGGTLTGSGMMKSLTDMLTRRISSRVGTVGATVGTGLFSNMVTGDQFLSIILVNSLYKKLYEKNGFESRLLSRTTEDSVTVTSVLIPWNSCGMTQSTVLGVATLTYLPYCIFNLISPLMSLIIAIIGYRIPRRMDVAKSENC